MENASKALLIAGAILICILIIAIGMYIYNSAQGTIQTAASQMGNQEKDMYNATVKKYVGDNKRGSDAKIMIEEIITQNNQNVGESGKFISINAVSVDGFDSTELNNNCKAANVYEQSTSNNDQAAVNTASNNMRELKKKISSGKTYSIKEEYKDGIIYKVTITQITGITPPTT